jgi:hypothetical protein
MGQLGRTTRNTNQPCVHHWLCGDQKHGSVHAVCTKCGTETDFMQGEFPEKFSLKNRKVSPTLSPEVDALH